MKKTKFSFKLAGIIVLAIIFSCDLGNDYANIEYVDSKHDFGNIRLNDSVSHTFLLKNKSHNELFVYSFSDSCECIKYKVEDSIIKKNDTLKIGISYLAERQGVFADTIILEANTSPVYSVMFVNGTAIKYN